MMGLLDKLIRILVDRKPAKPQKQTNRSWPGEKALSRPSIKTKIASEIETVGSATRAKQNSNSSALTGDANDLLRGRNSETATVSNRVQVKSSDQAIFAARAKPQPKNLYVYIDTRFQERLDQNASVLALRHPGLKAVIGDNDALTVLFDLIFPHSILRDYYFANLTWHAGEQEVLRLALRPEIAADPTWPLGRGCAIAAIGIWAVGEDQPIFRVQQFYEVADAPGRSYEVHGRVFVYKENPREPTLRSNNVLTTELARELPTIAARTADRLRDWSDFLEWKRNLIRERTCGLRYTAVAWSEGRLVFRVVAENQDRLQEARSVWRDDVAAYLPTASSDPWSFELNTGPTARRIPRGVALGRLEGLEAADQADPLPAGCPWNAHAAADLLVSLSEDDQNLLSSSEDSDQLRSELLSRLPPAGFLANSSAGDLYLIGRHAAAIARLRDQGGYAPYLSTYLFDINQARQPAETPVVTEWFRADLNLFQKQAVQKMLAAPDLCLIQGPPGTGKTTVIAEAIMQLTRAGQSVLLVSQAHTAVDNALFRLGRHPNLRPIRLARFPDKISDEGKPFVESAALSRYYRTLAEHTTKTYLEPWRTGEERLDLLSVWCEKAEYARRDVAAATEALNSHDAEHLRLMAKRDQAWQELQVRSEEKQKADQRRHRLEGLRAFLAEQAEEIPSDLELPEPAASALADALFRMEELETRLPVSPVDWATVPAQRSSSLMGLLHLWRKILQRRTRIEDDIKRLAAAGTGKLRDPSAAVRIEQCKDAIKELERQLESEANGDDPTVLAAWKTKRQELKHLQTAATGCLSIDIYGDLFTDAEQLCAPVEDAAQLCGTLKGRMNAVDRLEPAVREASDALLNAAREQMVAGETVAANDAGFQDRQKALEAHDAKRGMLQETCEQMERTAAGLREEATALLLNTDAQINAASFDECFEAVQRIRAASESTVEGHRNARATWESLLEGWREDLSRPDAGVSDWAHFKDTFLPTCNAVAMTCNESELTLTEAGLMYFDVVIIDEVSKATPVELLLPLMRARRAVLVGDHRQLPPLFQEGLEASTYGDELDELAPDEESRRTALTRENLERFENMITASLFRALFEAADDSIRARLEIQFRMHPQIMELVNHFYEHRLTCGLDNPDATCAHKITLSDKQGSPIVTAEDHVLWVDTSLDLRDRVYREDSEAGGRTTRSNRLEAELIADTLVRLDAECAAAGYSAARKKTVGVVSFYANQVREIRRAIRRVRANGRFECLEVDTNTVIRYQGKEKQIILVSLVRNDGIDPRRAGARVARRSSRANVARFEFINVAFSRAQELLIVFGARSMIESYVVDLPNMDREGRTSRPVYRDILASLERQARVVPASQFMAAAARERAGGTTRPTQR